MGKKGWVASLLLAGCGGGGDAPDDPAAVAGEVEVTGWAAVYAGLDADGMEIPRIGVYNATLKSVYGTAYDSYGTVVEFEGKPFVQGRVSWFGGPEDFVVGATETGAITGEGLRKLNDPLDPSPEVLAAKPEAYYYCAMRFDYTPKGKAWWKTQRILVVNPKTGVAVVVRPVDWGPSLSGKRILDLSPQAIEDLGLVTDQNALVAFAAPGTPLGRVE